MCYTVARRKVSIPHRYDQNVVALSSGRLQHQQRFQFLIGTIKTLKSRENKAIFKMYSTGKLLLLPLMIAEYP